MIERAPAHGHRYRLTPIVAVALVLVVLSVMIGEGAAQETSDTSQPAPSTTVPPTTTTTAPAPSTTAPPPSTTTAPPPSTTAPPAEAPPLPSMGEPAQDPPSEPVPTDPVATPPPPAAPSDPAAAAAQMQQAEATVAGLRSEMQQASTLKTLAAQQVTNLQAELAALETRLALLDEEVQRSAARLRQARERLQRRAVASYVVAPSAQLNNVLDVVEFNELARRIRLLAAVARSDQAQLDEYQEAKDQAGQEVEQLVASIEGTRSELAAAEAFLAGVEEAVQARGIQLSAAQASQPLVSLGAFVFPVAGPHTFTDTFGAPRMTGTVYAHNHQGTDIFAPHGTPLVACERGVLIRVGTDVLGGTKLWLAGASGNRYFYAHLSAFADGVVDGKVVNAGDVVGYVGNTGNALTTPPHLHFEVHPGAGAAINPYPLLRITDTGRAGVPPAIPLPAAPPTSVTAVPG